MSQKLEILAESVATLDVLNSFAAVTALENNYVCPEVMNESNDFVVKNGRHPVLELIFTL